MKKIVLILTLVVLLLVFHGAQSLNEDACSDVTLDKHSDSLDTQESCDMKIPSQVCRVLSLL